MTRAGVTIAAFIKTICSALFLLAFSPPALAQNTAIPNLNAAVDENGVDLSTGRVDVEAVQASIGVPGDRLSEAFFQGAPYGSTHAVYVIISTTTKQVVEGNTRTDYVPGGTDRWVDAEGLGGILTRHGSGVSEYYMLEAADGTQMNFAVRSQRSPCENIFSCTTAAFDIYLATEITRPDGRVTEMTFARGTVCQEDFGGGCIQILFVDRLETVETNDGREIRLRYQSNVTPSHTQGNNSTYDDWIRRTQVQSINLAEDYCAPYPAECTGSSVRNTTYPGTSTVRNAAGQDTIYTNNATGRLASIQFPGHSSPSITYSYGATNRVSQVVNRGVTWTYSFTENAPAGEFTAVRSRGSLSETFVFAFGLQRLLRYEGSDGVEFTQSYNSLGLPDRTTREDSWEFDRNYDSRGNVTRRITRPSASSTLNPIVLKWEFDATCTNPITCNRPNWTEDALSNRTEFTWDPTHGQLLIATGPAPSSGQPRPTVINQYTTVFGSQKNSSGTQVPYSVGQVRLTLSTFCLTAASCPNSADERVTTYEYNHPNLMLTRMTVAAGDGSVSRTFDYAYDVRLTIAHVDGPLGGTADRVFYHYDVLDRLIGVIYPDPDGSGALLRPAQRYTYDSTNRLYRIDYGTVTGTSASALNAITVLRRVENAFDQNDRQTEQRLIAGGATHRLTQFSYDTLGRPDCTAQRMNPAVYGSLPVSACTASAAGSFGADRISRVIYDSAGRISEQREAMGTPSERVYAAYAYDTLSRISSLTDANGNRSAFAYDGFDRLDRWTFPSPTTPGSVNASDYESYSYDRNNSLTSVRRRSGDTIAFGYDRLNRRILKDIPGGTAGDVHYGYDLAGNLTAATFGSPTGSGLSYSYDALSQRLSAVQTMMSPAQTLTYAYDAAGNRTRITFPDTQQFHYSYDILSRVDTIRETSTSGTIIADFVYDNLGQRVSNSAGAGPDTAYSYDSGTRLSGIALDLTGGSNDLTLGYAYNPVGQAVTRSLSNSLYRYSGYRNGSEAYTANGLSQYTNVGGQSFTHDANGNLTSDGSTSYAYDIENRLTLASGGVSLSYDPLGRLYRISGGPGGDRRFLHDGAVLAGEYNGSGNLTARYVHGPGLSEPLVWYNGATVSNGTRRFLLADRLGSIVATSDHDGDLITPNRYSAWGESGSGNIGRFGYAGQAWLGDIGLSYNRNRMYAPERGRFMQADPIGYEDGMNLYAYVHNDPVNFVDPLGLRLECPSGFTDLRDCRIVVTGGVLGSGSGGGGGGFGNRGGDSRCDQWTLADCPEPLEEPELAAAQDETRPDFCDTHLFRGSEFLEVAGVFGNGVGTGLIVTGGVVAAITAAAPPAAPVTLPSGGALAATGAVFVAGGGLASTGSTLLRAAAGDRASQDAALVDLAFNFLPASGPLRFASGALGLTNFGVRDNPCR